MLLLTLALLLGLPVQVGDSFAGAIPVADTTTRPRITRERLPPNDALSVPAGTLRVEFVIETDGSVKTARVVGDADSYKSLLDGTLATLRQWQFEPGQVNGAAVPVLATLRVTFAPHALGFRGGGPPPPPVIRQTWAIEDVGDAFGGGALRLPIPGVRMPRAVKMVKPTYPSDRSLNTNGMVDLDLVILANGHVGDVRVIRSADPRFDNDAIKTARQWVFEPTLRNGEAISVIAQLSLEYRKH